MTADATIFVDCGQREDASAIVVSSDRDETERISDFLMRRAALPDSRIAIVHPTGKELPFWLDQVVGAHKIRMGIGQRTVQKSAEKWARNFLATLQRQPRWATTDAQPYHHRPAFIVGAGVGLERNGHLLQDAARVGPIVAVNSSAALCRYYGVEPDIIVCCEAHPLPDHLEPFANGQSLICLAAVAAQESWDAAGQNVAAFAMHEPKLVSYQLRLGVTPLHFSHSSACAATALSLFWGAHPLVLVGQSNAVIGGRCYASASPFAAIRVTQDGGFLRYDNDLQGSHQTTAVLREAIGGGDYVLSDLRFDPVIAWYSRLAQSRTLIQASEVGARIPCSIEADLADVIAMHGPWQRRAAIQMRRPDTGALLDDIRRGCRRVLQGVEPSEIEWIDLLSMWTVPAAMGAKYRDRPAAVAAAALRGAREILEVIG